MPLNPLQLLGAFIAAGVVLAIARIVEPQGERLRFSLRSLLIFVTGVALVLGAAVAALGQDAVDVPAFAGKVRVHVGDELLPLAEIVRRTAADERLAAYRQLRAEHGGTAAGQLEVARWCRKQGLEDEERLHWRILQYMQPGHPEAIKALRLQTYQGAWLSNDEIARIKEEKKLAQKAEREWRPKINQIKQSIERGPAAAREQAVRDLESIRDPLAMPVVEELFADGDTEIGLLVVEMFARLAKPASTAGLIRLAVQSPDEVVRKKAAGELRYQPLEAYVPLLIAGLEAPIELSSTVAVDEGGPTYEWHSTHEYTGRVIPGMFGVIRLSGNYTRRDVLFWTLEMKRLAGWRLTGHRPDRIQYQYVLSRDSPDPDAPYEYTGTIAAAGGSESLPGAIAALKARIEELNAASDKLNRRIHAALIEATGVDAVTGKPAVQPADADVHPRVWWNWWRKRLNLNNYVAQGTEVWTQTGLAPIERVLVGDRVLTRDVQSEELTFCLVIGIDAKSQEITRVIEVNSRTMVTTPEQPFFVADEGWRPAERLEPGMELRTLDGPQRIDNVRDGLGTATYSLLIADEPNYLVDRQGILIHDATRP